MKIIKFTAFIMVFLLLVSGCSRIDNSGKEDVNNSKTDEDVTDSKTDGDVITKDDISEITFQAEVITAGESLLVTPDQDSMEFRSSDKMSVSTLGAKITNQKGTEINLKDLMSGDILKITYNGIILESYPAQITASAIEVIDHDRILEGYLALIDDIYQEDSGLNSDITMISLDTTGWVELSDIQKEILFTQMKDVYGVEILEGTFDELAEQGIIDKENLFFPEGVHITIADIKINEGKDKITCSIQKWRSGLGAIGSSDVTAKYKDGKWTINKEGMWIS